MSKEDFDFDSSRCSGLAILDCAISELELEADGLAVSCYYHRIMGQITVLFLCGLISDHERFCFVKRCRAAYDEFFCVFK